ncbi:queuosine biosynthesis protein QueC [uncultured Caudovirales phage]|uniref:7-cyano-7-deazaguanine synthase n=1 Tax=uncultured Caudovirales phage TaxID=2100421 RepID=A0A6J5LAW4_9CAUD|nr:queuosine biosynthesis protein QueC [uncultured Caudovirales phage]
MKTVLIFSGGLDSTVLLAHLLDAKHEVIALSIDYGQKHRCEIVQAKKIVTRYGVEHFTADLSLLRPLLIGSSQTDNSVPVPHGHYAEHSMKATVVPNRNMLMLSVAGAWAISKKADHIAYGAHSGDHAIYPDCRSEFAQAMDHAFKLADWHSVELIRPFVDWTKADIVTRGAELGVPFAETWSCYEGDGHHHCGKCGTCVERREAFQLAGVQDPTAYRN